MKPLRRRVRTLLSLVLGGTFLVAGVAATCILQSRFSDMEDAALATNLARLEEALGSQLALPASKVADWANWDDAYAFLEGRKPDFWNVNLIQESLDNIGVDAIVFLDKDFRIFSELLRTSDGTRLRDDLGALLGTSARRFVAPLSSRFTMKGFARNRDVLYVYGSSPVRLSDGSGEPIGTIVYVKTVDDAFLKNVSTLAKMDVSLELARDGASTSVHPAAIEYNTIPDWIAAARSAKESLSNSVLTLELADASGVRVATLHADQQRAVFKESLFSVGAVLCSLALAFIAALVSLQWLLGRLVVSRLMRLTEEIAATTSGGEYDAVAAHGITVEGDDEIAAVASTVRMHIDAIARQVAGREEMLMRNYSQSRLATLGEMAGNIAHEINNPLAIVAGYAQMMEDLLAREAVDKVRFATLLGKMNNAIERAGAITRSMRMLVRDGARDPMRHEDIGHILAETLEAFRSSFLGERVALVTRGLSDGIFAHCRGAQIAQVVLSLVSNAVDAMRGAPEKILCVTLGRGEGIVWLEVSDSGHGVPQAISERIMDPFFTTKPIGEGTGIGLSIARAIALEHGGTLILASPKGPTVFRLTLQEKAG